MENDWKKRLGVVYSTNPDFQYTEASEAVQETLPPERQKLIVGIDRRNRGGKQVTLVSAPTKTSASSAARSRSNAASAAAPRTARSLSRETCATKSSPFSRRWVTPAPSAATDLQ